MISREVEVGSALHIVHGVLSLDVGGVERIVVDLTHESRRKAFRVSVLCVERPGVLASKIEELGGTVVSLDKPPGLQKKCLYDAERVLSELAPDVVHTHQIGALWYLGPGSKNMGIKALVHTEHTDNVKMSRSLWKKFKTRMLWGRAAKYCDRFCCVSDDIAKSARRWGTVAKSKVNVVLNGIDVERYSDHSARASIRQQFGIDPNALVVGTVGRLVEVKQQDLLIRAIAKLVPSYSRLHLLLVGDGPDRQKLQALVQQQGISQQVTFAGYQSAPERLLSAMDVFALSSRLEGLPLAMLEAWATGLPVVSSAVGGIPRVIQDGVTGLLFPSGDLESLCQHLMHLLDSEAARKCLAEAGHSAVRKQYSLTRMASDYDAIYREVIDSKA